MELKEQIIARKRAQIQAEQAQRPLHELAAAALGAEERRNLQTALGGPQLRLIAEVRRPTGADLAGLLFDPRIIAQEFAGAGAATINVCADDPELGSELHLVKRARRYMALPVICWDFFIDEYQIYQAWEQQADAVTLPVELLSDDELGHLIRVAQKLYVAPIVVVRDGLELQSALSARARVICIENRMLESDTDALERTEKLAGDVPPDVLLISAHGITTREDAQRVAAAGADAAVFEPPVDYDLARDAIRDLRGIDAPGRTTRPACPRGSTDISESPFLDD